VKYALIRRHCRVWPIRVQCRMLGVSVAGYHEHFGRRLHIARRRHLTAEALVVHIRAVFTANRGAYGWPRIWRELSARGVRVGKRRVQRLMQQHGIRARGRRRFRVTTTDSRHSLPIAPNLLNRNFAVAAPNQAWTGDITYIPTHEGWLFLAVVMDLFSRRVVGWSMHPEMRSNLVIDALEMAWFRRGPDKSTGRIFHSDRGSQYASQEFSRALQQYGITASMSRKGDCWDNAPSEALFASLKVERIHGQRFQTIRQAKDETLAWLLCYNQTRLHSTLGYVSPIQFEQRWRSSTEARAS
jgi:putative transposase